jgi:L-fuconolactonase
MRIDAHQHFWNHDPIKHFWINDDMKVIKRDFSPGDLAPLLKESKFDGTIAVQADETMAETTFLLDLARKNDYIKAVVGWVDLRKEAVEEDLLMLKSQQKLAGFRCIMQGTEDEAYLKNSVFLKNVSRLTQFDFTYDLLVFHNQMESLVRFTDKLQDNRLILDHIGKPDIKNKQIKQWKEQLRILSSNPNIYCKLSGMLTEADHQRWTYDDIMPYMETAAEYFGVDRLCFGSDWPVCLLAGSFKQVHDVVDRFVEQLNTTEREKIFGTNAAAFYKI